MAKVRRADTFMGCCTLLFGVEIVCLINLLTNIFIIAIASSVEPIELVGITISPTVQVLNAAWCLGGIPLIIGAGVGAVYRIESHLRLYYWYMVLTFVLDAFWWISFLVSGSICGSVVSSDVQRMGTAFVCGFTDTFVFFWMLIGGVVGLYFIYIVWSASEEINSASYPELMKYRAALRGQATPIPTGNYAPNREMPSGGGYGGMPSAGGYGGASYAGGQGGFNSAPAQMYSQGMVGTPQSFVPQPPGMEAGRSY